MKLRLFWVMLLAFVLVIGLGVCGMLGSFGTIAASFGWLSGGPRDDEREAAVHAAYAELFADYYIARGGSWAGIDQRLDNLEGPLAFPRISLLDNRGRVLASTANTPTRERIPTRLLRHGTPVLVDGQQIGTLFLWDYGGPGRRMSRDDRDALDADWEALDELDDHASWRAAREDGPPSFFLPFITGMLGAGGALTAVLLLVAVVFASRLSRPVRNVTAAAQQVADGKLDVQVPGAAVRELDDLAGAFNRMAVALADADRQRRQMTADVAHELRTPLAIIKGRLEGLQDGVYTASPDQIGRLLAQAALLERLIEDLRVLALAEAGQLPLFTAPCDVRALLEDTAALFAEQAAAQGVALRAEAAPDLPVVALDVQRMGQVLANLVGNALRYTPAGGEVVLHATALPDAPARIELVVHDTGQGIAPADLPHLFDRFWRADRARTRSSGGSGLGLAIARQIVLAHGGAIAAESTPGQGTTLRLTLLCERDAYE